MSVLALAVITALALGLCEAGNSTLHLSDQHRQSSYALFAAEGGMQVTATWLTSLEFSSSPGLETLASDIAEGLPAGEYFGGQSPTLSNGTLVLPEVSLDHGTFQTFVQEVAGTTDQYIVTVAGRYDQWEKRASVRVKLVGSGGQSPVWQYGVATQGPMSLNGSAHIVGVNTSEEGDVYTAWSDGGYALDMKGGGARIDGEAFFLDEDALVNLNPSCMINGYRQNWPWDEGEIWDQLHKGVEEVEFPEPDISVFEAVAPPPSEAVTKVQRKGNVHEYHNVRIKAGSNPNIASDVIIKGILYIEAPNKVTISGAANITGVIVAEDGRGYASDCEIQLTGGMTLNPVDDLPDTDEFRELKKLKGTSILAPGFGLKMTGGSAVAFGGTIAVEELRGTGGAGAHIKGTLLCWGDEEMKLSGNAGFYFDHSDIPEDGPAGFISAGGDKEAEFDWSSYKILGPGGV